MHSGEGKETIHQLLTTYRHFRQQMLDINNQLRKYIRQSDRELYELLRTIPCIGPLTGIVLITELGNINRFRHMNQLSSYVGLIPRIKQSGESERVGDLTFRCNRYLRTLNFKKIKDILSFLKSYQLDQEWLPFWLGFICISW